jgi:hypothetical protein
MNKVRGKVTLKKKIFYQALILPPLKSTVEPYENLRWNVVINLNIHGMYFLHRYFSKFKMGFSAN